MDTSEQQNPASNGHHKTTDISQLRIHQNNGTLKATGTSAQWTPPTADISQLRIHQNNGTLKATGTSAQWTPPTADISKKDSSQKNFSAEICTLYNQPQNKPHIPTKKQFLLFNECPLLDIMLNLRKALSTETLVIFIRKVHQSLSIRIQAYFSTSNIPYFQSFIQQKHSFSSVNAKTEKTNRYNKHYCIS